MWHISWTCILAYQNNHRTCSKKLVTGILEIFDWDLPFQLGHGENGKVEGNLTWEYI